MDSICADIPAAFTETLEARQSVCAHNFSFDCAQAMVAEQQGDANWGAHARAILEGRMWQAPRGGRHDDKAHPPIHPTRHSAFVATDRMKE